MAHQEDETGPVLSTATVRAGLREDVRLDLSQPGSVSRQLRGDRPLVSARQEFTGGAQALHDELDERLREHQQDPHHGRQAAGDAALRGRARARGGRSSGSRLEGIRRGPRRAYRGT